jgi:AcrR family transcriptional regulator
VKRESRRAEAQADILAAAAPILARHGYHGTSMRDLAKATGRGLSSFYTYFPSKDALLVALQTRAFMALIDAAQAASAVTSGADRRLYGFILNHVQYFSTHAAVMRVLVQEARVLPPKDRRRVRAQKERYFDLCQQLVRQLGSGRGGYFGSPANRLELERVTYNIFGMLNWVWAWYEPETHGTARDVARSIHAIACRSLTGRLPARGVWNDVERALGEIDVRPLISVPPAT